MRKIAIGLLIILLASCGTSYSTKTDTFADVTAIPCGFPAKASFSISSVQQDNPLFVKEVTHKIATFLQQQGYIVCNEQADFHLIFDCKMGSEKVIINTNHYVPGKTEDRKGSIKNGNQKVKYKESAAVSGEWKTVPEQRTHYTKMLSLRVTNDKEEIWNGSATSVGERGDLREAVDYLLYSIMNYFGSNTNKQLAKRVNAKDLEERLNRLTSSSP